VYGFGATTLRDNSAESSRRLIPGHVPRKTRKQIVVTAAPGRLDHAFRLFG
jgi:hypothetical protein